ncbi:MAG: hypothetical protein HKN47_03375 [Pirellulaceae bacterium]|nr:hypothetical protein [Pirellulaceae bacterium]
MSVSLFALSLAGPTVSYADKPAAEAEKTETISVFSAATMEVPPAFKRAEAKSRIIEHEFQAKAGDGDDAQTARVTMMAAGGDVDANIKRWQGQFAGGDPEQQKTEAMKIGDWQVHLVDVNGSFAERMGGGPFAGGKVVERKDYAMTGAILVHPEGRKYFVKMIGPAAVVKANREAFVKMIKSIEK